MSERSVILVTTDVKDIDVYRWHATPEPYIRALVDHADAAPLLVPSYGEALDLRSLVARCDGVLMTGSRSNVHPPHYGEEEHEKHGPFDHDRDATTLALARTALDMGVPLFAICRGHQELNVALGGTLVGEVHEDDERMDHRSPDVDDNDVRFRLAHTITTRAGGMLQRILGPEPIHVNSLHRQAVGKLAPGLEVEATAEDGTIEATSVRNAQSFAMSVQWHPEYWAGRDSPSTKLFEAFGEAARAHRASSSQAA